jgi:hypothetical protein
MYLHNKYTKWYYNIVDLAKSRSKLSDSYYEKHHIIPKSLGGTNDVKNLVLLTAREHFICHLLLTKMVTGDARRTMAYACARMIHGNKYQQRYKINSSRYQQLRIRLNKYLVGRTFSNETRKKMSDSHLGEKHPLFGQHHSEESRKKMSLAQSRRTHSLETKEKLSKSFLGDKNPNYGKSPSKEIRRRISTKLTGRSVTDETRSKISKAFKGEKHPLFGKHRSEETKEKIRLSQKKRMIMKKTAIGE